MGKQTKVHRVRNIVHTAKFKEPGEETVISDPTDPKLHDIYNQYHQNFEKDTAAGWLQELLKKASYTQEEIASINRGDSTILSMADFTTARLLLNQVKLPEDVLQRFAQKINKAIQSGIARGIYKLEEKTIKDRVKEKTSSILTRLEQVIDDRDKSFSLYNYLNGLDVGAPYAKAVIKKYQPVVDELNAALNKTDPQVVEGYRHVTKKQLIELRDFIENILDDSIKFQENKVVVKKIYKPRKKKLVNTSLKMKYLKTDEALKITSISPSQVIGSAEVWIFNTTNRVLTRLVAANETGIQIKGSTMENVNDELSLAKKIRKPEEFLAKVMSSGKVQLRHLLSSVSSKPQMIRRQVREQTLILRGLK